MCPGEGDPSCSLCAFVPSIGRICPCGSHQTHDAFHTQQKADILLQPAPRERTPPASLVLPPLPWGDHVPCRRLARICPLKGSCRFVMTETYLIGRIFASESPEGLREHLPRGRVAHQRGSRACTAGISPPWPVRGSQKALMLLHPEGSLAISLSPAQRPALVSGAAALGPNSDWGPSWTLGSGWHPAATAPRRSATKHGGGCRSQPDRVYATTPRICAGGRGALGRPTVPPRQSPRQSRVAEHLILERTRHGPAARGTHQRDGGNELWDRAEGRRR